jgi:hypothetical protein
VIRKEANTRHEESVERQESSQLHSNSDSSLTKNAEKNIIQTIEESSAKTNKMLEKMAELLER